MDLTLFLCLDSNCQVRKKVVASAEDVFQHMGHQPFQKLIDIQKRTFEQDHPINMVLTQFNLKERIKQFDKVVEDIIHQFKEQVYHVTDAIRRRITEAYEQRQRIEYIHNLVRTNNVAELQNLDDDLSFYNILNFDFVSRPIMAEERIVERDLTRLISKINGIFQVQPPQKVNDGEPFFVDSEEGEPIQDDEFRRELNDRSRVSLEDSVTIQVIQRELIQKYKDSNQQQNQQQQIIQTPQYESSPPQQYLQQNQQITQQVSPKTSIGKPQQRKPTMEDNYASAINYKMTVVSEQESVDHKQSVEAEEEQKQYYLEQDEDQYQEQEEEYSPQQNNSMPRKQRSQYNYSAKMSLQEEMPRPKAMSDQVGKFSLQEYQVGQFKIPKKKGATFDSGKQSSNPFSSMIEKLRGADDKEMLKKQQQQEQQVLNLLNQSADLLDQSFEIPQEWDPRDLKLWEEKFSKIYDRNYDVQLQEQRKFYIRNKGGASRYDPLKGLMQVVANFQPLRVEIILTQMNLSDIYFLAELQNLCKPISLKLDLNNNEIKRLNVFQIFSSLVTLQDLTIDLHNNKIEKIDHLAGINSLVKLKTLVVLLNANNLENKNLKLTSVGKFQRYFKQEFGK